MRDNNRNILLRLIWECRHVPLTALNGVGDLVLRKTKHIRSTVSSRAVYSVAATAGLNKQVVTFYWIFFGDDDVLINTPSRSEDREKV